jgi:CRISPR-associated protein Cas2
MARERDDAVWLHVSFDLPTTTPKQKHDYRAFREFLLQEGFSMAQFSIYVRYVRRQADAAPVIRRITGKVPPGGDVVALVISDRTWAQATRFSVKPGDSGPGTPQQLELF